MKQVKFCPYFVDYVVILHYFHINHKPDLSFKIMECRRSLKRLLHHQLGEWTEFES